MGTRLGKSSLVLPACLGGMSPGRDDGRKTRLGSGAGGLGVSELREGTSPGKPLLQMQMLVLLIASGLIGYRVL